MISLEALRQQSLIAALWSPDAAALDRAASGLPCQSHPVPVGRGLQAYRGNAHAHAVRALQGAFPTVQALIGADDFAHLAVEHWLACPPQRGDLAQWGAGLGAFLDSHLQLADWAYLGDCARLDWACHLAASAADASLDGGSLSLLADGDPARMRLVLMPGVAVVTSVWPVVSIRLAHAHPEASAERDQALAAAGQALRARQAENALVSRRGTSVSVVAADAVTARWTSHLLAGRTLAEALDALATADRVHGIDTAEAREPTDARFDLGAWLATAIRSGWLRKVLHVGNAADVGVVSLARRL